MKANPAQCLTIPEIIEITKRYIDSSSYEYAILIDGKWGSGKTHFAQYQLKPELDRYLKDIKKSRKSKKAIYISLYGVSSREEITKQLWIEALLPKMLKGKEAVATFNFVKTMASSSVQLTGLLSGTGFTMPDFKNNMNTILSFSEDLLIIFDDLERSSMNINELLGYINGLVEHSKAKVILIANEEEIATTGLNMNRELKYLVAQNDIKSPVHSNTTGASLDSRNPSTNDVQHNPLHDQAKSIFGEDVLYKQIKEKLIGITIGFKPDSKLVLTSIAETIKMDVAKKAVERNLDISIELMEACKHYNFRTFQFAIDKFCAIMSIIDRVINDEGELKLIDDIFKYTFYCAVKYKMSGTPPNLKTENEIWNLKIEGSDFIKTYRYINDFVQYSRIDIHHVNAVFEYESRLFDFQESKKEEPLNHLVNNWFLMTDRQAKDLIAEVNAKIVENPSHYSLHQYASILAMNITLKRVGIVTEEINGLVQQMKFNLDGMKQNPQDTFNIFGFWNGTFSDKEDVTLFTQLVNELIDSYKEVQSKRNVIDYNSYLKESNWLERFISIDNGKILNQKGFLKYMDVSELVLAIKQLQINDLYLLRSLLTHTIYKSSNIKDYLEDDYQSVIELADQLDKYYVEIQETEKIKSHCLYFFVSEVKEIANKLKPHEPPTTIKINL